MRATKITLILALSVFLFPLATFFVGVLVAKYADCGPGIPIAASTCEFGGKSLGAFVDYAAIFGLFGSIIGFFSMLFLFLVSAFVYVWEVNPGDQDTKSSNNSLKKDRQKTAAS